MTHPMPFHPPYPVSHLHHYLQGPSVPGPVSGVSGFLKHKTTHIPSLNAVPHAVPLAVPRNVQTYAGQTTDDGLANEDDDDFPHMSSFGHNAHKYGLAAALFGGAFEAQKKKVAEGAARLGQSLAERLNNKNVDSEKNVDSISDVSVNVQQKVAGPEKTPLQVQEKTPFEVQNALIDQELTQLAENENQIETLEHLMNPNESQEEQDQRVSKRVSTFMDVFGLRVLRMMLKSTGMDVYAPGLADKFEETARDFLAMKREAKRQAERNGEEFDEEKWERDWMKERRQIEEDGQEAD